MVDGKGLSVNWQLSIILEMIQFIFVHLLTLMTQLGWLTDKTRLPSPKSLSQSGESFESRLWLWLPFSPCGRRDWRDEGEKICQSGHSVG